MGKQGNQRNDRQYDAGAQTDMAADKRADLSGITPSDGIADQGTACRCKSHDGHERQTGNAADDV